jgi:hypothetical protein
MKAGAWCLVVITACGSPPPAKSPAPADPIGAGSATPLSNAADPGTPAVAATPLPVGATVGTAHPTVVEAAARDGSWIAICQARKDTNGDGKIEIQVGHHGDVWGDTLTPFVIRHAGEGEPIDLLVDFNRDRWLVALRQQKLAIFDALTGAWQELPRADLRDDGVPLGPHRAASVANAAERMVYFKDDQTMIVRDLATAIEKTVKVPGAKLWRVEVEPLGHWAKVYAIQKDTDGDGKLTWPSVRTSLSSRGCRGPIASYSTGGWDGDKPDELWLDLATAKVGKTRGTAPSAPPEDPPHGVVDGRTVIAVDATGQKLLAPEDKRRDIPDGPLVWVKP